MGSSEYHARVEVKTRVGRYSAIIERSSSPTVFSRESFASTAEAPSALATRACSRARSAIRLTSCRSFRISTSNCPWLSCTRFTTSDCTRVLFISVRWSRNSRASRSITEDAPTAPSTTSAIYRNGNAGRETRSKCSNVNRDGVRKPLSESNASGMRANSETPDSESLLLRACAALMYVLDDLDLRHGNQSLVHHLVEIWNQLLHFVLGVDDADHNG